MTKREMYDRGWYRFPMCETVAHLRTDAQWIDFIDRCGEWLWNEGLSPSFMPEWLRKMGVRLEADGYHYDAGSMLDEGRFSHAKTA